MRKNMVDPFTLDIIKDSLLAIGEEIFISVARASKSPVIYEVLDFASGLTDADANLLTQGNGVAGFIGMLAYNVRQVLQIHKGNINPGDIFILNIPYEGGGSHLSDVGLVMPIFYEGEIVAFTANKAHWTEVGGKDPGSWSVDANEIYQEGLQFPCVKIVDRGVMNEPLVEMIKANVRFPDLSIGDMYAQIAGLKTGEKRMIELCEKFSLATVKLAIDKLLTSSHESSVKQIEALTQGEFFAEDYIEDDGLGSGPVKVQVKVTIKDGTFTADFRGSSPMVRGPINTSFEGLASAVKVIFVSVTNPSQDINDGVFRPLNIIVDDNSIFNAKKPAATSTYWESLLFGLDLVWKALAPAMPDKLTAACYLSVCAFVIAGTNPATGEQYINVGPSAGGWGAGLGKDGENAQFCPSNGETFNIPVEVLENRYGFLVEEYSLKADGAGAGEFRGGLGVNRKYKMLNEGTRFTGTYGRFIYPPWGINGGADGSRNCFYFTPPGEAMQGPYGKSSMRLLQKDEVLYMATGTGGGYGNPLDRPAEKVLDDVINEYVSIEDAQKTYGVLIEKSGMDYVLKGETPERLAK